MELLFYAIIITLMVLIVFVIISIIFNENTSTKERSRVKQVKKQEKKKDKISEEERNRQLVDTITKPLAESVLSNYKPKRAGALRRKLRVTGWNKYFNPMSWMALRIWCVLVGVFLCFLMWEYETKFALALLLIMPLLPNTLLNNEYKNINEALVMDFPETIRVVSGYLSAGLILPKAFEMASKSAKPRWKKILTEFVERCNTDGVLDSLEWIKEEIDFMEAREFFASVRMAIDDGIDPLESFDKQAKNIQQMLDDINQKKIEKRKMLATVFQGPLLLMIIATFALPILGTAMDFFASAG